MPAQLRRRGWRMRRCGPICRTSIRRRDIKSHRRRRFDATLGRRGGSIDPHGAGNEGLAITQIGPTVSALDNPVWSSLSGPHRDLAGCLRDLMWYPPSIAPFVAVPDSEAVPDLESARRQGLGDLAYFVGACPNSLPDGWQVVSRSFILQLFPHGEISEVEEHSGVVLGPADKKAMRELTQIAFPDFFRERTAELGVYLGIYEGAQLIAMAGERLALPGLQEI